MKCPICGCENPEGYKFCHDCGSPLNFTESIDDLTDELNNLDDFPSLDSKKLIIIGYMIAILFGWGSFILSFFLGSYGFIGFIGLFFPGFMLNSMAPMALMPPIPMHCRKLVSPKTPPAIAPPTGPVAIAAMATGITLNVIARGPIFRYPRGV